MKHLAGVILIVTAEQAYSHAFLIAFPYQGPSSQVLIPVSGVLLSLGIGLAIWGLWEHQPEGDSITGNPTGKKDN